MNPIQSNKHSNLQVLPKARRIYNPMRQITPKQGILWTSVEDTLKRFNWTILDSTDLFVRATHPQTNDTIQISHMGQGTVMINQNYVMLAICDLADLEIIADVEIATPTHTMSTHAKGFSLRKLLRRFL